MYNVYTIGIFTWKGHSESETGLQPLGATRTCAALSRPGMTSHYNEIGGLRPSALMIDYRQAARSGPTALISRRAEVLHFYALYLAEGHFGAQGS